MLLTYAVQVLFALQLFILHGSSIQLGPLSITLQPNNNYRPDPVAALQRARYKYGGSSTTNLEDGKANAAAVSGGRTTSIPLKTILYDVEYYATVQVGTPSQSLRLNFDTGSADLWFGNYIEEYEISFGIGLTFEYSNCF